MTDLHESLSPTPAPQAWLVRVDPGTANRLMDRVLQTADRTGAQVLVLDGDVTFGLDHLASALHHAMKAFEERRNSADSLAMETLLYASGERQLGSAIKKMGVSDGTTEVVVARLTDVPFEAGDEWAEYVSTDGVHEEDKLIRFGLSREELATVHESQWLDLVLERVAAVDLIKK